jgi:hypothetical protein
MRFFITDSVGEPDTRPGISCNYKWARSHDPGEFPKSRDDHRRGYEVEPSFGHSELEDTGASGLREGEANQSTN